MHHPTGLVINVDEISNHDPEISHPLAVSVPAPGNWRRNTELRRPRGSRVGRTAFGKRSLAETTISEAFPRNALGPDKPAVPSTAFGAPHAPGHRWWPVLTADSAADGPLAVIRPAASTSAGSRRRPQLSTVAI